MATISQSLTSSCGPFSSHPLSNMSYYPNFWDVLAQFHAEIEDSNFDLASVRRLLPEIEPPVPCDQRRPGVDRGGVAQTRMRL